MVSTTNGTKISDPYKDICKGIFFASKITKEDILKVKETSFDLNKNIFSFLKDTSGIIHNRISSSYLRRKFSLETFCLKVKGESVVIKASFNFIDENFTSFCTHCAVSSNCLGFPSDYFLFADHEVKLEKSIKEADFSSIESIVSSFARIQINHENYCSVRPELLRDYLMDDSPFVDYEDVFGNFVKTFWEVNRVPALDTFLKGKLKSYGSVHFNDENVSIVRVSEENADLFTSVNYSKMPPGKAPDLVLLKDFMVLILSVFFSEIKNFPVCEILPSSFVHLFHLHGGSFQTVNFFVSKEHAQEISTFIKNNYVSEGELLTEETFEEEILCFFKSKLNVNEFETFLSLRKDSIFTLSEIFEISKTV